MICTAATLGLVLSVFSTGKGSLSIYYLYISYKIMCTGMKTYMGQLKYLFIVGVYYHKDNICVWLEIHYTYLTERKEGYFVLDFLYIYIPWSHFLQMKHQLRESSATTIWGWVGWSDLFSITNHPVTHKAYSFYIHFVSGSSYTCLFGHSHRGTTLTLKERKTTLEEALVKSWEVWCDHVDIASVSVT